MASRDRRYLSVQKLSLHYVCPQLQLGRKEEKDEEMDRNKVDGI